MHVRTIGSNPFPQLSKTLRILSAREIIAHMLYNRTYSYLYTKAIVASAKVLRTGLQAFSFSIAVRIALSSSSTARKQEELKQCQTKIEISY